LVTSSSPLSSLFWRVSFSVFSLICLGFSSSLSALTGSSASLFALTAGNFVFLEVDVDEDEAVERSLVELLRLALLEGRCGGVFVLSSREDFSAMFCFLEGLSPELSLLVLFRFVLGGGFDAESTSADLASEMNGGILLISEFV